MASCLRDPPLDWENFGKGHMDKHCNGCHSSYLRPELRNEAPVGVDFDTYEMTVDWADRVWERGHVQRSMPPGGGPGPDELQRFQEWMICDVLRDYAASRERGE